MRFNLDIAHAKFAELAHVVGAGGAEDFVPWLMRLKREIGIAPSLSAVGVQRTQIPALVNIAEKDICHQTNPRLARAMISRGSSSRRCEETSANRDFGVLLSRRRKASDFHRQDAAVCRAVNRALGAIGGRARAGDSFAGGADEARRRNTARLRVDARRTRATRRLGRLARQLRRRANKARRSGDRVRDEYETLCCARLSMWANRYSAFAAGCRSSTSLSAARCTRTSRCNNREA